MRTIILSLCLGCSIHGPDAPPPLMLDTVPSQPLGRIAVEPRLDTCDFRGATIAPAGTRCAPESTRFYIVSEVRYPEVALVDGEERALGLDLDGVHTTIEDGMTSTGCANPDLYSPDGVLAGIDNMGAVLRPTFDGILASGGLHQTARDAIAEGRFGAVIELRNWNETPEDDCVDVFVYEATFEPDLDAFGRLAVDQRVVSSSDARPFSNGRVQGGELRADLGGFPIPQPFMADLHNAHVRVQLTDTAFSGLLVGELPVETGVASLICRTEGDFPSDVLRSTAEAVADLRPTPNGCTSLSWGVTIRGVRAIVD